MSTKNKKSWTLIQSLGHKVAIGILTKAEAEQILLDYHTKRMNKKKYF